METCNLKKEEPWIDIVKWIACMLVLLGHFFQSMVKSGIMQQTALYDWFQHTIYLFHVPLFFICSGYLYQHHSVVNNFSQWGNNVLKKIWVLGVPYCAFTIVSYLMKVIFQGEVNAVNENSLVTTLLFQPMSPYWYLYSLFFLFLITPTLRNRKQALWTTTIVVCCFFFHQSKLIKYIFALQGIFRWELWFLCGMLFCFFRKKEKQKMKYILTSALLIPMTLLGYNKVMSTAVSVIYELIGGMLGCTAVVCFSLKIQERIPKKLILFSRRNTLPVFLMHTIFAAGIRSILLKLGVTSATLHIVFGISGSIILPIIAAAVMRKSKWMYFWIQPDCLFVKNKKETDEL